MSYKCTRLELKEWLTTKGQQAQEGLNRREMLDKLVELFLA